ncbi:MAG: methyl-accepting chemotaxis protein [Deltaproteobacteria bacterium]|nr:methyl-accepting chemotaxis protein [Deltaproteobacteria bacterium]
MRLKTVQQKIAVWSGACLIATAAIIVIYSTYTLMDVARSARERAIQSAETRATEIAENIAGEIKAKVEIALDSARTLAQALSGIKDKESPVELDREEVNSILKIVLDRNPQFVGTYTLWEPNAFDGLDSGNVNAKGHDATGRFIPYWCRNQEGKIAVEPLVDYEKEGPGDYYQVPKKTKKEAIIDPYIYPVQGKDTLITSLVVPVVVKDVFYGIAGIDLKLEFLQQIVDNTKELYGGTAEIAIISNNGTLGAYTRKPGLAGKHMKEAFKDREQHLPGIREGKIVTEKGDDWIDTFVPVRIGATTTPWSVSISIPTTRITAEADNQMTVAIRDMWSMILIGVACAVAATILLWLLARGIARPLHRVAQGLNDSAEQVASASNQVASSSQSLAEGSSEQAASIEETSSSLEEMSSMTKQNAENASQADSLMKEANQVVVQANESMTELTSSMAEIRKASEQTSKIIKTIDEIAFQTNLLALNAAVEAARAGEAGAGFAVVADEVRNLAMRAAEAARNTADLIEGTVKKVKEGSDLVAKTSNAFAQVAGSASKVGDLVSEISAASREQAMGIDQLSKAVAEMDKVTQQNAANAEESSSTSEEMKGQAERMKRFVADLVAIIGGSAKHTAATRSSGPRSARSRTSKEAHVPPQKGKSKAVAATQAREVKPEEVIPLEEDFNEF